MSLPEDNPWSASDGARVVSPAASSSTPSESTPLPAVLREDSESEDPWAAFERPSGSSATASGSRDIAHQATLDEFDPFSPNRSTFDEALQRASAQTGQPSPPEASTSSAAIDLPSAGHSEADIRSGDGAEEAGRTPILSTLGSLFKRPLATPPPAEQAKQAARTSGLMQAIVGSGSATPAAAATPRGPTPAPLSPSRRASAEVTARTVEKEKTRQPAPVEEAPFDFNRFLEQVRDKRAEAITRYFRSFLREFNKRPWKVQEQIRVINDFLDFISTKMRNNDVWAAMSEHDFDNAIEGMEKLVMNRVYDKTFTPALAQEARANNPTDDLERDHVLSQRMRLFGWLQEEHLDLPKATEERSRFLGFAQAELRKINQYKAPRDKLITILNSCKVIYGLMRQGSTKDQGADLFVPYLILVVLRANPEHLVSNIQYIQRFRNPEKLQGEAGYYLSSLNGAISFIETLDYSGLSNITQDDFEHQMEQAIADVEGHASPMASSAPITSPPADHEAATPVQGGFFDIHPLEAIRGVFSDLSLTPKAAAAPPQLVTGLPVDQAALPPLSPRRKRGYTNSVYSRSNESLVSPTALTSPAAVASPQAAAQQSELTEAEADARRKQQANLATLAQMFPSAEPSVLEIVLLSHAGEMNTAIDSLLEMT